MNKQFLDAVEELEKEKGIDKEEIFRAIEDSIRSACSPKNRKGQSENEADNTARMKEKMEKHGDNPPILFDVDVVIDRETGDVHIYASKLVVETVTNVNTQISLGEAIELKPDAQIGDVLQRVEVFPENIERTIAHKAKTIIVQQITNAERKLIYSEYQDRQYEVVAATVLYPDGKDGYIVRLDDRTEAILPASQTIPNETYFPGQRLKVCILKTNVEAGRTPLIRVSRSVKELVKGLFENEVPEIAQGSVVIKAIAREAGSRTKIAVASLDPQIDPVGACVGKHGSRVGRIVQELRFRNENMQETGSEKIDIITWSPDPEKFIVNALSPASVVMVFAKHEDEKSARVIVKDDQLSLAIGKNGQNARLAANLTGWKIDIKTEDYNGEMTDIAE